MPAQKKQKDTVSKHMGFRYVEHMINRGVPTHLPVRKMDVSGSINVRPEPLVMTLFRPPPETTPRAFFNPEAEQQQAQHTQPVQQYQGGQGQGSNKAPAQNQPVQTSPVTNTSVEAVEEMDWSSSD